MSVIKTFSDKKPPPVTNKGRPAKYPWATMALGHYFIVPSKTSLASISSAAYANGKKLKRKFTVRTIEGVIHVWRIK